MTTKTKKGRRNTAAFYALLSQMPGYNKDLQKECKEVEVSDFLVSKYGQCKSVSLSALSDQDYEEILHLMRLRLREQADNERLLDQAERKRLTHLILTALSRIGVVVVDKNMNDVNYHIRRLPISKGRIIPQFATKELPALLGAVRGYTDAMSKIQQKVRVMAANN